MSEKVLDQHEQHEAERLALSVQFNDWSQVMIQVMIQELEEKMLASDLPVAGSAWQEEAQ